MYIGVDRNILSKHKKLKQKMVKNIVNIGE